MLLETFVKLFIGFCDEQKWLDKQGEDNLLLENVENGKYHFKKSEKKIKYFIDHTEDSPFTELNGEYIKKREANGYKLACIKGRCLYFYTEEDLPDYSERYRRMIDHIRGIVVSFSSAFVIFLGLTIYENKLASEYIDATFKNITPQTVAWITLIIAAASLGVTAAYSIELVALIKKKKEVVELERAQREEYESDCCSEDQTDNDIR